MTRPLIFIGSRQKMGRLALVADTLNIKINGILDHHLYGNLDSITDIPVIGDERWLLDKQNTQAQEWIHTCDFFVANWWNGSQILDKNSIDLQLLRQQRIQVAEEADVNVINLIHPNSQPKFANSRYADLSIGKGLFVDDDVWISVDDVSLGDYCCVATGSKIVHHTHIGNNVIIAPEAYIYNCNIGDDSYFGMFSRINVTRKKTDNITIGKNCTVWSDSTVVKNVPNDSIYTDTNRVLKKVKFK